MNYYNEFDPKAAAWIRELIKTGMIPDGEVDERSITDVRPSDLKGYVQHHFFCGIGGWPYALRLAGWPDSKECWTGSAPCQPFSVAGKGKGLEDERHLWPAFRWLIAQCRPSICFGEQVASKDGREWLAGVRSDLETMGYVVGAADLCAASVGAPHIRQRLWWVGYTKDGNWEIPEREKRENSQLRRPSGFGGVVNNIKPGLEGYTGDDDGRDEPGRIDSETAGSVAAPSWNGPAAWWPCRDGKLRRIPGREIEPEIQRVVDGISPGLDGCGLVCDEKIFPLTTETEGRAHLLRGYGNAIVPQVAAEFIGAVIESIDDLK
jgi:DNA (cytosine-5)-methyltransferase 1